jgi:membrane-associated protease RseP (regulator of RpoE activity)
MQQPVTDVLRADYAAFNYAAVSYAVLFEMALRLYEPPLRELAPKHLRAYAEAAQTINQLIAGVAAGELAQAGLECHCICPMCGIGACGCVSLGTARINAAWRDTAPDGEPQPGFPLQPPRAGSPLAGAGVQGGDRLLEVDGQEVHSVGEIQAAIREHAIGEELQLLVQRGSEAPREIRVEHVSDYAQA